MRFEDYIEATNAAETPEALFDLLQRAVAELGYSQIAYSCVAGPMPVQSAAMLPKPDVSVVFLKFPPDWITHYLEYNCHRFDPVLKLSQTLQHAFTWDWLSRQPYVERAGKIFMLEAEAAGLRDGVTIPMTAPGGSAFTLNMARSDYGGDPGAWVRSLRGTALQFHYAYCNLAAFERTREDLVLTELAIRCLILVAGGLTLSEVSDRLKIPEQVIYHELQIASKQLGTRTLVHTVLEAIRAGFVPLEAVRKRNRDH